MMIFFFSSAFVAALCACFLVAFVFSLCFFFIAVRMPFSFSVISLFVFFV